jgi:hypothetical protein
LPVAALDHLMSRNKVLDEKKDGQDDVLSNGDDIGAGDFQNLGAVLHRGVEVDVVRADTSRDADFQFLGLLEEFSGEVPGVERRCDQDLGINDVLLEDAVRAILGV